MGMMTETPSRGSIRFPEISIYLPIGHRSLQICLPRVVQLAAASTVVVIAVVICYFGLGRIGGERAVADEEASVDRLETANADLRGGVASLRDKPALAVRDHRQAEAQRATVAECLGESDGDGTVQALYRGRVAGKKRLRQLITDLDRALSERGLLRVR